MPGQDQSCATRTGVSTCEAFVQNNGSAFDQACESFFPHTDHGEELTVGGVDWEVRYVKIFQTS